MTDYWMNPPPCPSCGRQLLPWNDPYGKGFQCDGMDCMEMWDWGEVVPEQHDEETPPDPDIEMWDQIAMRAS